MKKPKLPAGFNTRPDEPHAETARPPTTGRYIVVFRNDKIDKGIEMLESFGLHLKLSPDSGESRVREDQVGDVDAIVFSQLGVAVVAAAPDLINQLADALNDRGSPILAIEPERVRHVITEEPSYGRDRDDQNGTAWTLPPLVERVSFARFDESQTTWGLQITNTVNSRFSGRGVRVAVLDTGIDLTVDDGGIVHYHPDFEGRTIIAETFVPGTTMASDQHGHGTHCLGIACGPLRPAGLPRYGIAHEAEIVVGKVANDTGDGHDGWIIAGIEWAISKGCRVISLSLGNEVPVGGPFSIVYETIALRALAANVLIVAAAGNCEKACPVNEPANCPSIMAVGAIDQEYQVAYFSSSGINPNGGEIDIVAPGVYVYSSYLLPKGHAHKSGTSMAAPHVAGIAALYAEAHPGVAGQALWDLLIKPGNVHRLPFSPTYVGAGLVQAPR